MRKLLLILSLSLFLAPMSFADEGMWLLNMLDSQLYQKMREKGLQLKPGEIYDPSSVALTDAIVALDGGSCSGSIISNQGLMITNHHCAYGDIHALSTPSKNYLEEGFWAMNMEQEIPIAGKSVTFLRGIADVTELAKAIIDSLDAAGPRGLFFMNKVSSVIEKRYASNPYEKLLTSEWRGSKYLLYFYETFNDVRLVGAPPAHIGAFGGETDNWGWPQHKGDFAIYRVYTGKDGKPANYSKENIPLKPRRFLSISSKGVKEGDFSMILGYPGRTNRYSSSFEAKEKFEVHNPLANTIRRAKLDVWKKYMDRSDEIRLKYADKYFGVSNYTDYAKWENLCIARFDVIGKLRERESELQKWILASPERVKLYGKVLENLEKGYAIKAEAERHKGYFQESLVKGAEFITLGQRFKGITLYMERQKIDSVTLSFSRAKEYYDIAMNLFESADIEADKELFGVMLNYYINNVPESFYAPSFKELLVKYNRDCEAIANYIYSNSVVTSKERTEEFFSKARLPQEILNDPIIDIIDNFTMREYNLALSELEKSSGITLANERGRYIRAMYQMQLEKGETPYPDANSTMRLTFGQIGGITPRDAVKYNFISTSNGILEKEDPSDYEFRIGPKLKEALKSQQWGRWSSDGKLYINFMSDNDITGGNSGSPVMNGKGELIGLAFDGNRESMAGDLYFEDGYNKSVSVDIRYVLWVIDKYAGASNIINEMVIK